MDSCSPHSLANNCPFLPDSRVISCTYDANGNPWTTTAPGKATGTTDSITTSFIYDKMGRKTGMSDPDMGTWHYQYNAFEAMPAVQTGFTGHQQLNVLGLIHMIGRVS
jgi:YD repeat-containing protein